MTLDTQTLRDAFRRKRYGAGEYDPDFDLFDAAADEIERLRALLWDIRRSDQLTLSLVGRINHALVGYEQNTESK